MTAIAKLRAAGKACADSTRVFLRDVGAGLLEVSHNSLALLGLCVVGVALFAGGREELRTLAERHALDWLQARQEAREPARSDVEDAPEPEPDAVARATAADPKTLPRQQAAVAQWLSRRYKVAPEPVSRLVLEAWAVGHRLGLDPTLILAVMAVESSFNPFAQSAVGAQGLMQVMTRVHDDKYEAFGGVRAAFDPVANLRVGVQVLKECIARAGSLEAGLRSYLGVAGAAEDGGYVGKVLNEQGHLRQVAEGRNVAVNASNAGAPAALAVPVKAPAAPAPPSNSAHAEVERVALLR
jgi:soluble lytic murein transglycosylase-like protein